MYNEIKEFILKKQELNCERIGDLFPHTTENGKFDRSEHCGWTGGFYAGLNYLCYEMSGKEIFKETNDKLIDRLEKILAIHGKGLSHDIGMLFTPSTYAKYVLFKDERAKEITIKAGNALCERYKPEGGYIQAWDQWGDTEFGKNNLYRMIVDCLFNLPLLFRCHELTGDKKFYDIAYNHAKTAQKYLVRDDYTTAHTFVFNPDGTPRMQQTLQGHTDTSCWSRGQGWATTGFAWAYKFTGDESFLETSKKCAEKFLELTEDNLIPKWDFDYKGVHTAPRDTSAASIIGLGFMELYDATGDENYKSIAEKILFELYENYATRYEYKTEGLLTEGSGFVGNLVNINVSLIYGDYCFAELLTRLTGKSKGYW